MQAVVLAGTFFRDVLPILSKSLARNAIARARSLLCLCGLTTKRGLGRRRFGIRCGPAKCLRGRPILVEDIFRTTGRSAPLSRSKLLQSGQIAVPRRAISRDGPPEKHLARWAMQGGSDAYDGRSRSKFRHRERSNINISRYLPVSKEDRWVQAVEVRPGDRRVVHHIVVYIREAGFDLDSWTDKG